MKTTDHLARLRAVAAVSAAVALATPAVALTAVSTGALEKAQTAVERLAGTDSMPGIAQGGFVEVGQPTVIKRAPVN